MLKGDEYRQRAACFNGGGMMPKGDEYRQYAAELIQVAQQVSDPIDKAMLLRMAEIWQGLALKADEDKKRGSTD